MKKQSLWLGMTLWLASAGCVVHVIEGSGDSATEERSLPDFTEVGNTSTMDTVVTAGGAKWIAVTCDDNLIQYIRTTVEDGALKIAVSDPEDPLKQVMLQPRCTCNVDIQLPRLTALENTGTAELKVAGEIDALSEIRSTGTGPVDVRDIDVLNLDVSSTGTGNMALAGTAANLDVESTGAGNIDASQLEVEDARVEITGTGNVSVQASQSVEAELTGTGNLTITGDPDSIRKSETGTGRVIVQ